MSLGFVLTLPSWLSGFLASQPAVFPDDEARMRLVVHLAAANVRHGTGGPFGAAIFDLADGALIAPGINQVVPQRCSLLHAEMVALLLAQQRLATHDLATAGRYQLVTSVEPCAMCLGAIPWSGVVAVVCGAPGAAAEAIGFDEGDKPADWPAALARRGIGLTRGVLADEAGVVLRQYRAGGGPIYNGGD